MGLNQITGRREVDPQYRDYFTEPVWRSHVLRPASVGCAVSHCHCIQYLAGVGNGECMHLIVEDDITFNEDSADKIVHAVTAMEQANSETWRRRGRKLVLLHLTHGRTASYHEQMNGLRHIQRGGPISLKEHPFTSNQQGAGRGVS